MVFNITSVKTSSDGVWQGDNPLQYAFPLLILQTTLVILISRSFAFFLKRLHQPKVVAEILGGIMLGPSALGRNQEFTRLIFPAWSTPILESVASIGLLFFLFLVGLELDLAAIRRSGKKAFGIAAAGISLPFLFGIGTTFLLRKAVSGADRVGYAQSFLFMGVSLSITAFPVLARILAELKLLTTQVGETAMAAAAFNDIAAWVLLALAVALAGGAHKSPLVSLWVLVSGSGFIIFMILMVRPVMEWVSCQCSQAGHHDIIEEGYICLTLAGVMLSGFTTDLIGIHAIFGAFVFGLMIPKKGDFAGRLIKRIEDFVCGLLLPLYFASSGLKTDVSKIQGLKAWGLLVVVVSTACTGKILGTFLVAMFFMIPARESLALGLLMNTKGLVELIVLNIGKEKKVLNDEMFAILVMMALITTFMTTPLVMAIYKPARSFSSRIHNRSLREASSHCSRSLDAELRILACVHGSQNSTSFINLIESIRSPNTYTNMKLYIMHMVELTERSSSIMMVHRARKNGVPCINRFRQGWPHDQAESAAFAAYGQVSKIKVRSLTAISGLPTMHDDICHVAEKKRAMIIILPYHRVLRGDNTDEELVNVRQGWKLVNRRVLMHAPCSVALFVARGFGTEMIKEMVRIASIPKRVCVLFIGGPDNREALELGRRMAAHPATKVTIVRFLTRTPEDNKNNFLITPKNVDTDKELDEASIKEFQRQWEGEVEYVEQTRGSIEEGVLAIGQSQEYELVIVGKGRFPEALVAELHERETQQSELGPIGDLLLASSGQGIASSVLVVQKHSKAKADKTPDEVHDKNYSTIFDQHPV